MAVVKTLQQDVAESKERAEKIVKDADEEKTRVTGDWADIREEKADKNDVEFKMNGVNGEISMVKELRSGDVKVCMCVYVFIYIYMYIYIYIYIYIV